jgi:uncharacterized protein YbjT (DUF2867 family)
LATSSGTPAACSPRTTGTAKLTIDQHHTVDVELNAAFARGLKASGRVNHLSFMSAVGANPTASTTASGAAGGARYHRVKGEAEDAVKSHGPRIRRIGTTGHENLGRRR